LQFLDEDRFILETGEGFDHHHEINICPGRGLSADQKAIALECYATGNGAPKKVWCNDWYLRFTITQIYEADFNSMQVIRQFTRLANEAARNNLPIVPTPAIKMVGSFLTYHRLKERGGLPVGGQTIEDIVAFATQNMLTENTPRNVGGCVHLTYDTQRDEPLFVMLIRTNGLLDGMHLTSPIETDETYKVIYEGYPVTVIGQSDMNRTFHVR
jgi:hypothetical protein